MHESIREVINERGTELAFDYLRRLIMLILITIALTINDPSFIYFIGFLAFGIYTLYTFMDWFHTLVTYGNNPLDLVAFFPLRMKKLKTIDYCYRIISNTWITVYTVLWIYRLFT